MTRHSQFEIQLENFRHEANAASTYLYAGMAVQHAASKSKKLLNRLNRTPSFWNACNGAFQSAAYISLARIFDDKSRYNIGKLLDAMEANLQLFQRDALAERKRASGFADPKRLDEYLSGKYYPSQKDVVRLRKKVADYRLIYERAVMPVRHKYLAHRVVQERSEVSALYGGGTIKDLWRLTTFTPLLPFLGFDFPSPERRLDISPTSGGLGEHCLSSAAGHVLCALLGRVAQPRLLAKYRGNPKGGAPGSPFLWLLSFWRSKRK